MKLSPKLESLFSFHPERTNISIEHRKRDASRIRRETSFGFEIQIPQMLVSAGFTFASKASGGIKNLFSGCSKAKWLSSFFADIEIKISIIVQEFFFGIFAAIMSKAGVFLEPFLQQMNGFLILESHIVPSKSLYGLEKRFGRIFTQALNRKIL
ncbi:hypothetical protein HWI79_2461 [Cryptosporidium felis]|nr:hypothetical protein HWI79_2461 [Cryptosporidium felis]